MLAMVLLNPEWGNLEGKGAGARAVAYPLLSFMLPLLWAFGWRSGKGFPWLADLLITVTCFTDILGNRLDLYDAIVWFDDWMHLMNTGLLAAAALILTQHWTAGLGATIERALAVGATGAIVWELAEYAAFLANSSERRHAYTDTLGDLTLGTIGALVAALVVHALRRAGRLRETGVPIPAGAPGTAPARLPGG